MPANLDLASWLKHIGLSQHVEQLRHHGLDLDLAADLSDEDLVALGLSLGDRRRFLREATLLSQDHRLDRGGYRLNWIKTTLRRDDV